LHKNRYDEDTWNRLSAAPQEYRVIRDAHLYRALSRGKMRLTEAQFNAIKTGVVAKYSFSDALIKAANACIKEPE
jgi:hypothetical protein